MVAYQPIVIALVESGFSGLTSSQTNKRGGSDASML